MASKKQIALLIVLVAWLISTSGCGSTYVGNYKSEIRVKRGLGEDKIQSLQDELEKARKKTKGFVEKLQINPGGRYVLQNIDRQLGGEWWIADDGRLAFRTTHQNGKSLGALVSEGADRYLEIGSDGNLYRYWNNPDSELEFVFVKQ